MVLDRSAPRIRQASEADVASIEDLDESARLSCRPPRGGDAAAVARIWSGWVARGVVPFDRLRAGSTGESRPAHHERGAEGWELLV